jgi:hypothetical protein
MNYNFYAHLMLEFQFQQKCHTFWDMFKLNDTSKMRDASKQKLFSFFITAKEPEPPTKQSNTVYQIQINVLSPCQL